jgi:ADP-ribosylglycohydrolase
MVSDDTEHAFLTAQALLVAGDDASVFASALARRLRWWLVTVPGGCGKATAQGLLRSWIGIHPSRCGVRSAGNGPAMRAAIIGLRWADHPRRLAEFINASTAITHRDERARIAALAIATAAAHVAHGDSTSSLFSSWRSMTDDVEWRNIVNRLEEGISNEHSVDDMASKFGCPTYVSGYAYTSVPLPLYAWLRHPDDAEACLTAILRCGGDTDTMGAIAAALIGASRGRDAFPES